MVDDGEGRSEKMLVCIAEICCELASIRPFEKS